MREFILSLLEWARIRNKPSSFTPTVHGLSDAAAHTAALTPGQMVKGAATTGLPADATNTDAEVASAVSLKHSNAADHAQNTDSGTTGNTFDIDSDSVTGKIRIDVALGAADKTLTLTNAALTDDRTQTLQDATGTVALAGDYQPAVRFGLHADRPLANTLPAGTIWLSLDTSAVYYVYETGGVKSWQGLAEIYGGVGAHEVYYSHALLHSNSKDHDQGTDTGTKGADFTVDSDSTTGKLKFAAAAGAADKTLTLTNAALTDNRTITLPDATGTVALTGAAPATHAASHTNSGDDIQSATAAQKGLATSTQITKLDGIEAGADVTDATNVAAAGALMSAPKLDDCAAPDDNTDLDVSATKHGLCPKITDTAKFLKGDGTWATPAGGAGGGIAWVAKTTTYTAATLEGILADTTGGAWSLTLPPTPSAGDTVGIVDAKSHFATAALTILRNGVNIMGAASDLICNVDDVNFELVYSGATLGWVPLTWLQGPERLATAEQNIAILGLQLAATGALARLEVDDGFLDAFNDETAIQTKTGATYDSANDKYSATHHALAYGNDILTGGTATADTEYLGTYSAEKASDDNTGTRWRTTATASPHWWKYDLGAGVTKIARELTIYQYTDFEINAFTLQGSNNGIDWATVYDGNAAHSSGLQSFTFANSTAYRYYRIYITSGFNDSQGISVVEFQIMEVANEAYYENVVLESTPCAADSAPSNAHALFLVTPIDSIALNTDLKGWVSRDDGSNYTQFTLATMEAFGSPAGMFLYGADAAISSTSGTNLRIKLTTHNGKGIEIYGWALLWRVSA